MKSTPPYPLPWWGWCLAAAFFLGIAIVDTYPLIHHWGNGIPYYPYPEPGHEVSHHTFGDHLQTFYYFWLFKDSLVGTTPLFTNPYEFQVGEGYYPRFTAFFFPLSLVYAFLAIPLGDVAGYNALTLLSYVAAGLVGVALVRLYTRNAYAALAGGLILALMPYRTGQLLGGHANGFIAFLVPLLFYCLERAFLTRKALPAVLGAMLMVILANMELHIIYYFLLLLGLYLPFRWLVPSHAVSGGDSLANALRVSTMRRPWVLVAGGALSAGVALVATGVYNNTVPRDAGIELALFALVPAMLIGLWWVYGVFLHRMAGIPLEQVLREDALSYLPLYLSPFVLLKFLYPVPYLGKGLAILVAGGVILRKAATWWKWRSRLKACLWSPVHREWIRAVVIPLGVGIILSVAVSLSLKMLFLDVSIAGEGRSLRQVAGFSPQIGDFFVRHNRGSAENNIYLGILPLLLAAAIVLRALLQPRPGHPSERHRLWILFLGSTLLLSTLLAFGPHLTPYLPLYQILYDYLPFFNYPRVAGRILLMGHWALAVLVALALSEWISKAKALRRFGLAILVLGLITVDYLSLSPRGIHALPRGNAVYEIATQDMNDGRILEVPVWPGDAAWSSLYEYYVTRYRYAMVNGYNPVVSKRYVEDIFFPLLPVNYGLIDPEIHGLLQRLRVRYLVFHEEVFPEKVSPYPAHFTLKNLKRSPYLDAVTRDGPVHLFRVRKSPLAGSQPVISPVGIWYEAEQLPHRIGRVILDPGASGGKAISVQAGGGEGHLIYGPYIVIPPGRYAAVFRIRASQMPVDGPLAVLDVVQEFGRRVLARRELLKNDFSKDPIYRDIRVPFRVDQPRRVEFRVFGLNRTDLSVDYVYVTREGQEDPPKKVEAESLYFQPFRIHTDARASEGEAVYVEPNREDETLAFKLRRRVPAGNYDLWVRYRTERSIPGALVEVRLESLDGRVLAQRVMENNALRPSESYRVLSFPFTLSRTFPVQVVMRCGRCPGLWVDWFRFTKRAD